MFAADGGWRHSICSRHNSDRITLFEALCRAAALASSATETHSIALSVDRGAVRSNADRGHPSAFVERPARQLTDWHDPFSQAARKYHVGSKPRSKLRPS